MCTCRAAIEYISRTHQMVVEWVESISQITEPVVWLDPGFSACKYYRNCFKAIIISHLTAGHDAFICFDPIHLLSRSMIHLKIRDYNKDGVDVNSTDEYLSLFCKQRYSKSNSLILSPLKLLRLFFP